MEPNPEVENPSPSGTRKYWKPPLPERNSEIGNLASRLLFDRDHSAFAPLCDMLQEAGREADATSLMKLFACYAWTAVAQPHVDEFRTGWRQWGDFQARAMEHLMWDMFELHATVALVAKVEREANHAVAANKRARAAAHEAAVRNAAAIFPKRKGKKVKRKDTFESL